VDHLLPEGWLHASVGLLVRAVEVIGALVIFYGALRGFVAFVVRTLRTRDADALVHVRHDLARYLALGLEFQLGADLLRTAVAPSFRQIGQLAAVAAIRTTLNYFLEREIRAERPEAVAGDESARASARTAPR
jgi:uncharacterized membrane protein